MMRPHVARGCRAYASRNGAGSLRDGFHQAAVIRSANVPAQRHQSSQLPDAEFLKLLRKPPDFFAQMVQGVKSDLRQLSALEGDAKLGALLSKEERKQLRTMIYTNIGWSGPVSANFAQSALGLPKMGASIYSHLWIGIVNYILKKKGLDPATASDKDVMGAVRLATYYRSPILVEEMARFGYSIEEAYEIIGKAYFMQYWSGDFGIDPKFFNPMTRSFFPTDKHISTGAGDLGREQQIQTAKLWALSYEKIDPPVTILNAGDTTPFTDGAMSQLQHMIEASERGIKMPMIMMINANNSSISSRLAGDGSDALKDAAEGVRKIEERLALWGKSLGPGFTTEADDVAGGVKAMQDAVDYVLETGKPTYVISTYPFRPNGHASDGSPASDELLLAQFAAFRKTLVHQICATADPGQTGGDLANELDTLTDLIDKSISFAKTGTKILTVKQTHELSVPGITEIQKDPGYIIDVPSGYFLGKGVKAYAGMGTDVYSKALESLFNDCDKAGRRVRYIHQENHMPNKTDTRGGVYGELNQISEHHLREKFINLLPNERQIAELGSGFRCAFQDSIVIVKGPHVLFNEHAKDILKYAAYRHCDTLEKCGYVYLMDGYNIAAKDVPGGKRYTPEGSQEQRELVMARAGEHHNSPYYSGYLADANCVCPAPYDMNLFVNMLPEMLRLAEMGRVVPTFLPTFTFGQLHPAFSTGPVPEGRGITQNDVLRVTFPGQAARNGKELVIVTYGPDSKWIAASLAAQETQATMFILNYLKPPNSLIAYLDDKANAGVHTEVIAVDGNPHSQVLAPIMSVVKNALGYPDCMHFSDCHTEMMYVPWGYGESLLNAADLERTLAMRGFIDGRGSEGRPAVVRGASSGAVDKAATDAAPSGASGGGTEEIVNAPMDGENVVISFQVKVGDHVKADDVVALVESDKATIEVTAPSDGKVTKFLVDEHKEMDVSTETQIFALEAGAGGDSASAKPAAPAAASAAAPAATAAASQKEEVVALSRVQIAMVDNMTVKVGDTKTFSLGESVDFSSLKALSKQNGVSPTTQLVKVLADSVRSLSLNKKLSSDKRSMRLLTKGVDIGVAVEVEGQLRVAVVRDASEKSVSQISADLKAFQAKGAKLSPDEQDLDSVAYVLTSLGKGAPEMAYATLPRSITGILAIGRTKESRSIFNFTLCHATLTGSEGANLMAEVAKHVEVQ